jgi:hypothetical protein
MLSALISFLGGSAFRMIWGEISSWLDKKQEHTQEIERIRVQDEVDANAHSRNLETLKLQSDLGVKQVDVQRNADVERSEAEAFKDAMSTAFKPTGIMWVDMWNQIVRPSYATIGLVLWTMKLYVQGFKMDEFDLELFAVIVGFFFADRSLRRNAK